ncbi:collagen-binding domain-containing protein [Ferrimicrobium sp.]|uniref:collagen-binding domain-containing protein n=1 Tax=Ferrimicrobium sp. TaxID=2926050 RepID=UPI002621C036|nr:collagen-binding domain-containing protein [Ferrimicrobium sp.]
MIRSLLGVPLIALAVFATGEAYLLPSATEPPRLAVASAPSLGTRPTFPWGVFVAANASLDGRITGGAAIGQTLRSGSGIGPNTKELCTSRLCGTAPLAFGLVDQVMRLDADRWAQLTPNMAVQPVEGGLRIVGTNSAMDVADLATLPSTPFAICITAPSSATVLINLSAHATQTIARLRTTTLDGTPISQLLWNFSLVNSVRLPKSSFTGSVLAPAATTVAPLVMHGDLLTENLITGSPNPIVVHDNQEGFDGLLPQYPVTAQISTPSTEHATHSTTPLRIIAP